MSFEKKWLQRPTAHLFVDGKHHKTICCIFTSNFVVVQKFHIHFTSEQAQKRWVCIAMVRRRFARQSFSTAQHTQQNLAKSGNFVTPGQSALWKQLLLSKSCLDARH